VPLPTLITSVGLVWRAELHGRCCEHLPAFFLQCRALPNRLLVADLPSSCAEMFALLFDLEDYATTYRATRDAYLKAANELKLATGPYKAARDAYVAATATYTKSLYE